MIDRIIHRPRRPRAPRAHVAGRSLLWLSALLLSGCGAADEAPRACDYAECPIDEASCVERTAEVVGCKLEQETLLPQVRFLTAAQFLAEEEASETPLTAEEERDGDDYLRVEALVGLMPEGYAPETADADQLRNFVAFYSRETKGIVILTDHVSHDPSRSYAVLVHELVHAYQDARWDLASFYEAHAPTYDRYLGLRALTEGQAVLHQNLAGLEIAGIGPRLADWHGYFADWQQESLESAQETATPALDTIAYFPYAFGGELVVDAWLDRGAPGVDGLYGTPPDSVRQVMGGHLAWPDSLVNGDAVFDQAAIAVMPEAYELITGGHESVWAINAMLQRTSTSGLWAGEVDDISADYLAAFRWNEGDVAAMWRIRTDQPTELLAALTRADARWVAESSADPAPTHLVTTVGDDVLLIAVSAGDARLVLADIAGWQSPDEAYPDDDAGDLRQTGVLGRRRLGGERGPHDHAGRRPGAGPTSSR